MAGYEILRASNKPTKVKSQKYPFDKLEIGYCFRVPFNSVPDNMKSRANGQFLRSAAFRAGQQLGRKFSVLAHNDRYQCWEVRRIS